MGNVCADGNASFTPVHCLKLTFILFDLRNLFLIFRPQFYAELSCLMLHRSTAKSKINIASMTKLNVGITILVFHICFILLCKWLPRLCIDSPLFNRLHGRKLPQRISNVDYVYGKKNLLS